MLSNPDNWSVQLGRHNTSVHVNEPGREQDFKIEKLIIHPEYQNHDVIRANPDTGKPVTFHVPQNDVALIKLDKPVTFTKWVKPLCLPRNDELPESGQRCAITGWGTTECK